MRGKTAVPVAAPRAAEEEQEEEEERPESPLAIKDLEGAEASSAEGAEGAQGEESVAERQGKKRKAAEASVEAQAEAAVASAEAKAAGKAAAAKPKSKAKAKAKPKSKAKAKAKAARRPPGQWADWGDDDEGGADNDKAVEEENKDEADPAPKRVRSCKQVLRLGKDEDGNDLPKDDESPWSKTQKHVWDKTVQMLPESMVKEFNDAVKRKDYVFVGASSDSTKMKIQI